MEEAFTSELLLSTYQTARCHDPEANNLILLFVCYELLDECKWYTGKNVKEMVIT
jgi:hypothetical protein